MYLHLFDVLFITSDLWQNTVDKKDSFAFYSDCRKHQDFIPSPWLCGILGADTFHMNLVLHEHVSNNQKIKVCQHFFRPKGTEQWWHGALQGSTESNNLFIKHRNTNTGWREVLTLELKVQAGEKRVREGERVKRKILRWSRRGGRRRENTAEVRGCRRVYPFYCVYPVSPFK